MKSTLKNLLVTLLATASLLVTAQEAKAQSVVEFRSLYGFRPDLYPTRVLDGGGTTLGEELEGTTLWFLCLEELATDPSNEPSQQWSYNLSLSPEVLTTGVWSGMAVADRDSIVNGISNMFINNQSAIYGNTTSDGGSFNTPGSAMQYAAWEITNTYGSLWSGQLDVTAINAIMTANASYAGTLVEDYLYSSLTDVDGSGRLIFGAPTGSTPSTFQSVILFAPTPVPEPSALILIGLTGVLVLGRYRRRTV